MSVSAPFIRRPVATLMLMLALFLLGLAGWRGLPVAPLPEVEYPTLQIRTVYPGAAPEIMESTITGPLEKQLGQISGLSRMSSSSGLGVSLITLQFQLDLDMDVAEQQVQAAINSAFNYLPEDLPTPPVYYKSNPADAPVLSLALTSSTLPPYKIEDIAETRLVQRISQLPGVGLVDFGRGQKPAIHIRVDPARLAGLGLSLEGLRASIAQSSIKQAKGSLDGNAVALVIEANDQLMTLDEFKNQIIAYQKQGPVRLSDVASVTEDAENPRQASWFESEPAIILHIHRQPGANTIQVVERIRSILPEMTDGFPASIDLKVIADRSIGIEASIDKVKEELWITILLVVIVIYLFVRNLPATLIPSLSVPLSLAGTIAAMKLFGFSLNNLTLMALTIATGFVVDDAIVMLENILRHMESGMKPREAALKGAGEIGFTILSLTASLIAVLIPLFFMPDILGRLFREFSLTLALSIIVSAGVSLTLTPMLAARLPRMSMHQARDRIWQDSVTHLYGKSLSYSLERPGLVIGILLAILALTLLSAYSISKNFFPDQDTGLIEGFSVADPSISFDAMRAKQKMLADIIGKDPDVEALSSEIGIEGIHPALSNGRFMISLKAKDQRADVQTIINRIEANASGVPGIGLSLTAIQDLNLEDQKGPQPYQFAIRSQDPRWIQQFGAVILGKLEDCEPLKHLSVDQNPGADLLRVEVDRDAAARLGVSTRLIMQTLYDAYGERQFLNRLTQNNQYRVILEVEQSLKDAPERLRELYLPSPDGSMIPLANLVRLSVAQGEPVVHRINQQPSASFFFNLSNGRSLESAMAAIEQRLEPINLPESITREWVGTTRVFQSAFRQEWPLILTAVLAVYILLGILYESYLHPLTILSTLPSAIAGGLLMLIAMGDALDLVSLIGMVLLIGIVAKNAIMMIDFAIELMRSSGMDAKTAIHKAATLRLRPILMTTFAALFAGLPLALGGGMGEELRKPLGFVMIGGLFVSQWITLYTTPSVFVAFDGFGRWVVKLTGRVEVH